MDAMNIPVPDSLRAFVHARVAEGGFSSANEYIHALIRADQKQQALAMLEAEVLKGLNSGPSAPMTAEDWESIREEVRQRHEARQTG